MFGRMAGANVSRKSAGGILVACGALVFALAKCRDNRQDGSPRSNVDAGPDARMPGAVDGNNLGRYPARPRTGDAGRPNADAGMVPSTTNVPCGAEIWTYVPGGQRCGLAEADVTRWCSPPREWLPCGTGCSTSPAPIVPSPERVLQSGVSARYVGDGLVLRLSQVDSNAAHEFVAVARIADGAVLAAVANTSSDPNCGTLRTDGHAPLLIPSYLGGTVLAGRVAASAAPAWQSHAFEIDSTHLSVFDSTSTFWGATFADGSVRMVDGLDATAWRTIEPSGGGASYRSAANDDLLIYPAWSAQSSKNVLKAWRKGSAEPALLYDASTSVVGVAATQDVMVWTGVDGPRWLDGSYDTFRFYWSPVAGRAEDVRVVEGPVLPITNSANLLDAAGDWIGVEGCATQSLETCRIILVRRSTSEVFLLRAPIGKVWGLLAVAPDEVLLAENDVIGANPTYVQRFTRIKSEAFGVWHASL